MADNFKYKQGLGSVGAFQSSAVPFLSSSIEIPSNTSDPISIEFTTVTKFIIITNQSDPSSPDRPIRFGFSANGVTGAVNNNYVVLENGETFEADFKVSRVYLISDTVHNATGSVVAGLTGVGSEHLVNNWSGSAGVG